MATPRHRPTKADLATAQVELTLAQAKLLSDLLTSHIWELPPGDRKPLVALREAIEGPFNPFGQRPSQIRAQARIRPTVTGDE